MTGLFYEEFNEGDEYVSPGRTITEADIVMFAGLSGDYNPLHTDAEFARETIFGGRIAHGLLVLSISTGLIARTGILAGTAMAFLGINEWKFTAPVLIGDTVHVKQTVESKRETKKADRGVVTFRSQVINHKGEAVQEGLRTIMVRRKPAE
ncbi:MAG: MaoC/PaaZ C-terminal domain-containing protein [bacterium]